MRTKKRDGQRDGQLDKKSFLKNLSLLSFQFAMQVEAEVQGFKVDAAERLKRVERVQHDFEFFARTYFPHYCKYENAVLHDYLYRELPLIVDNKTGDRQAIAAPRGNAKSTIVTQIFSLWCVLTGRKQYIVIVMDAFDQAAIMLEAIKAELTSNPRLMMDFPQHTGAGRVWQAGIILTANNCKIQVFGSGKRMRGLRHGAHRPDLVIGDDLENDENVRSAEQRDKLDSWLKRTVLSLGDADDSMDVIIIGTILHYDSVLNRLINNPLWESRVFQSIITWPHRMDLWDSWEEKLLNHKDKGASAQAFYDANEAAMNEGASVCWPSAVPLYKLMIKRARDGKSAFDSEQQNNPVAGENAPFAEVIDRCYWVNLPADLIYFGTCDPSLGKHGSGRDPSAILVGGYQRSTGKLYVVEASIAKRLPDKIISDVIAEQKQYRCFVWGVESVQFQEFFRTELVKRSAAMGVPVPARAVTPNADKLLRIESLQPHMANGLILLHPSQHTLIQQLRHFPKAAHDDGPDALHMLWALAVTSGGADYEIQTLTRKSQFNSNNNQDADEEDTSSRRMI